jgi:phage baseplate assembly protein W
MKKPSRFQLYFIFPGLAGLGGVPMENSDFLGQGWKFPPQLDHQGRVATSEGKESIEESIRIILGTAKGERLMRPEFGCDINRMVFASNTTATASLIDFYVREALREWEPRIEVLNVRAVPDEQDGQLLNISIDYQVRSKNSKYNLVYPFYLEQQGEGAR